MFRVGSRSACGLRFGDGSCQNRFRLGFGRSKVVSRLVWLAYLRWDHDLWRLGKSFGPAFTKAANHDEVLLWTTHDSGTLAAQALQSLAEIGWSGPPHAALLSNI